VFRALVQRGEIGDDLEANLRVWRRAHADSS
jgi:hypothetical protein